MLTPEQLQAIAEREQKATPGQIGARIGVASVAGVKPAPRWRESTMGESPTMRLPLSNETYVTIVSTAPMTSETVDELIEYLSVYRRVLAKRTSGDCVVVALDTAERVIKERAALAGGEEE
jgi:hypothetical protein